MSSQSPALKISSFSVGKDPSIVSSAEKVAALEIAKLSLLDWFSVAIAGRNEVVSQIVRKFVENDGGTGNASVFGGKKLLPVRAAALANGTISHALDYDDTHFIHIGHPSVAVFPAALALGQKKQITVSEILDAALIGMEVACRVGHWLGRSHYQIGFHQTATSGSFGATIASARLLSLTTEQTQHALGLVATRASGLKCQFGTMGKPYHAGLAASNGVEAALLAQAGLISEPEAMSCKQGFAETHATESNDTAFDHLGSKYVFTEVQHKFHACCHGTHAALEALISVQSKHDIFPNNIEKVVIGIHPRYLGVCNILSPETALQVKFSYRMTAAMILHGIDTAAISSYTDDICLRNDLILTQEKVLVDSDESISETEAYITISLSNGKVIKEYHDLTDPLTYQKRADKVKAKSMALIGQELSSALWSVIADDNAEAEQLVSFITS